MRHTLILLLCTTLSAMAATVEVISPTEVRVDGANFGSVADTIANNPKIAPDVQRALQAWDQKRAAEVTKQIEAKGKETTLTQAECDKLKADYAALLSNVKAAKNITEIATVVTAAELPERTREKQALAAQITELQAKLNATP